MTVTELGDLEEKLYSQVLELYKKEDSDENKNLLEKIFESYCEIHDEYAKLSDNDIEALKRGLFIQWIALTDAHFLTGISMINDSSQRKIIINLKKRIENKSLDVELRWMLNYYLSWDFVFTQFKDIAVFEKTDNPNESSIPKNLNKLEMNNRGQMGIYWKSINVQN